MIDAVDAGIGSGEIVKKSFPKLSFDITPSDLQPIESRRSSFIETLKRLQPSSPERDWKGGKGLTLANQSLLYLLEGRSGSIEEYFLREVTAKLEKVPLSKAIEEKIGYRPKSVVFHAQQ